MNQTPITCVIVDDEPLGRAAVREGLKHDSRFQILFECEGGEQAIRCLQKQAADVVFLDIHMPEVDGFEVLEALGDQAPLAVMVTAYDQHALTAFDYFALDYLLKPVDPERFQRSLDKVVRRVEEKRRNGEDPAQGNFMKHLRADGAGGDRLLFKCVDTLLLLEPEQLQWIEAAGNYLKLHSGNQTYLIRETMTGMTERLHGIGFGRVHRSFLVNLKFLREIHPGGAGSEAYVALQDGTKLPLGRTYRDELIRQFEPGN
ncbi:MAG: DNA-binding response regulator [Planctomycetota bacterium]|nr:MAG: DNA-binding response regulator [Planctomycetota bacterium]